MVRRIYSCQVMYWILQECYKTNTLAAESNTLGYSAILWPGDARGTPRAEWCYNDASQVGTGAAVKGGTAINSSLTRAVDDRGG